MSFLVTWRARFWATRVHPPPPPRPHPAAATSRRRRRQVKSGTLFVNGKAREEPFIAEAPLYTLPKLVVPPGDVSPAAVCFAFIAVFICVHSLPGPGVDRPRLW